MGITIGKAVEMTSIIGVFITAIFLWFTVRSFKKQLQLNFFSEYTRRYQEIILNLPESINEDNFDYSVLPQDVKDKTMRYMRAYFDLCSEEYFLKIKGNIDDETWSEWETGMKFAFSKSAFQQAWEMLQLDTVYYGKFSKLIDETIMQTNSK